MNYNQNYNNSQQGSQGYNNNQQGNQGKNTGYDNLADITIIGRMTKDPESNIVNNSRVASSSVAINHVSERAGTDFWFVEVWGNEGADSAHNFFVNHCSKGRRVLVKGTPELRRKNNNDGSYTYYPTIRASKIMGLDGGSKQGDGSQQNQQQPPNGQFNNYQQQPAQQQGYPMTAGQHRNLPPSPGQQSGFQPSPGQQPGFPPNPPGGYSAPAPIGAPNGAPGGFPGR